MTTQNVNQPQPFPGSTGNGGSWILGWPNTGPTPAQPPQPPVQPPASAQPPQPPQLPHADLRQSPIYRRALNTPDIMCNKPAGYYRWRKSTNYDNEKVQEACLRLDHLIRNAIDQNYVELGAINLTQNIVCAIKAFVRHLEKTLPSMQITQQTRNQITPRIEFCKLIAAESDRERIEFGQQPLNAEWFEIMVANRGSAIYTGGSITIDTLIYGSPFAGLYTGPSYTGLSLDSKYTAFHTIMLAYWQ